MGNGEIAHRQRRSAEYRHGRIRGGRGDQSALGASAAHGHPYWDEQRRVEFKRSFRECHGRAGVEQCQDRGQIIVGSRREVAHRALPTGTDRVDQEVGEQTLACVILQLIVERRFERLSRAPTARLGALHNYLPDVVLEVIEAVEFLAQKLLWAQIRERFQESVKSIHDLLGGCLARIRRVGTVAIRGHVIRSAARDKCRDQPAQPEDGPPCTRPHWGSLGHPREAQRLRG